MVIELPANQDFAMDRSRDMHNRHQEEGALLQVGRRTIKTPILRAHNQAAQVARAKLNEPTE